MHCVSAGARRLFRCSCCCWLLLVAAAAALLLCDEAAAQGTSCGKLVPGQVDPVTVAAVRSSTNSSITVDWLAPDRGITGYFYIVNCPSCPSRQQNTTHETFTFRGLTAATEYNFSIQAGLQNCRLSPAFHLSGRTGLNSIPGPVHISDVTETSFRARWAASPDVGVEYEVSCAGRVPDATAVCRGQPSGASVTVRVRPVKTGFVPGSYICGTALTKLFPIDASLVSFTITETSISLTWVASITEGVLYRMTCRRVSTGNSTSLPPSKYLSATVSGLQSGEAYNLSVAVSKQGGFHEVVTWLPIQLTKLFGIDASSAQYSSNETAI
uniref:Fibronectin type-III domain-containing protein n=1 Tax=Macrostomum lignano TaxID=282301 RepID=A0A1I8HLQ8_9PLAT